jgi:hypothetical protein
MCLLCTQLLLVCCLTSDCFLCAVFLSILILSTHPGLRLQCLILHCHACFMFAYAWLPVLTGFSQGFPFFLEGEWRRCCIQPDHVCFIPDACLHIIYGYLFISLKYNVCRLWNGDKSCSNC